MYQLKITLEWSNPPIWRRIVVRQDISLEILDHIIQIAMGWTNSHLHIFTADGQHYSDPEFEMGDAFKDERRVILSDLVSVQGDVFHYEYDMGDGWRHRVEVEEVIDGGVPALDARLATCISGERRCPPEDVGGVPGYEEFLRAINDADHPEHEDYLEWIGGSFDPAEFSIQEVNDDLRDLE
jgi:Plasmid pRiA4b ORF-3-like protein